MHWCPSCNNPCFCDGDDTDYGEYHCLECPYCNALDEREEEINEANCNIYKPGAHSTV